MAAAAAAAAQFYPQLHFVLLSTHFSIPLHFADTKFNLPFCPEVSHSAGAWLAKGLAVGLGVARGIGGCWGFCKLHLASHLGRTHFSSDLPSSSLFFLRFSYLFFILCSAWPQLPQADFDMLLLLLLPLLHQRVAHTFLWRLATLSTNLRP